MAMNDQGDNLIDPSIPVNLNVYDIDTGINRFFRRLGLGSYLTSVQVHGREYMFRAGDGPESGIVDSGDQQQLPFCQGLHLRDTILIGDTHLNLQQVTARINELRNVYDGNAYRRFTNNCNHFSNILCRVLTRNRIPCWVDRCISLRRVCCYFTDELFGLEGAPGTDQPADDNDPGVMDYSVAFSQTFIDMEHGHHHHP